MPAFLDLLLGENGFMPHGHCFVWQPEVLWTTVTSDLLIFASYVAISFGLWYFVKRRRDIEFKALFVLFGIFILACGMTHFVDVTTVWYPAYWVAGGVKAVTATASVLTAVVMFPLLPQALALPSPHQLRVANAELAELSTHLQTVRKDEKGAIARELHDELGGLLTAESMDLRSIQKRLQAQGNSIGNEMWAAIELLNSAVHVKRRVIEELHPTVLDRFGLAAGIRWLAESSGRRMDVKCELAIGESVAVGKEQSVDLSRIAQESLTNISKHAGATAFSIRLEQSAAQTTLVVQDNGRGAKPELLERALAHGIRSMRQRVKRWGGSLETANAPGGGFRVSASIPIPRD